MARFRVPALPLPRPDVDGWSNSLNSSGKLGGVEVSCSRGRQNDRQFPRTNVRTQTALKDTQKLKTYTRNSQSGSPPRVLDRDFVEALPKRGAIPVFNTPTRIRGISHTRSDGEAERDEHVTERFPKLSTGRPDTQNTRRQRSPNVAAFMHVGRVCKALFLVQPLHHRRRFFTDDDVDRQKIP